MFKRTEAVSKGSWWFAVVDGKEQRSYDGIGYESLIWRPDGREIAYVALRKGETFVVRGGREGKPHLGIVARSIAWSPDSKRMAYIAGLGSGCCVVVDGKEGNGSIPSVPRQFSRPTPVTIRRR